jgi:hypothetical protein
MVLVLAGCGSDPADPHVVGACDPGWTDSLGNPFTGMCESGCKKKPASTGMTCDTVLQLNCGAFEFDGQRGCCVSETASNTIRFADCVP